MKDILFLTIIVGVFLFFDHRTRELDKHDELMAAKIKDLFYVTDILTGKQ